MYKSVRLSIAALATALLFSANAMAANIAINGDVETGDLTGFELFPTGNGSFAEASTVNPSSGAYSLHIVNLQEASAYVVKQPNLAAGQLMPGQEVTISFDVRGSFGPGGVLFAELFSELDGGGTSASELLGGAPIFPSANVDEWTTFSFTTNLGPDVSGGLTLQFAAVTGAVAGSFADVFIDNIVIEADLPAPVPVPAAVWLMASALGLLGLNRKKAA
ncbi:MAG: hypothetical protein AAF465_05270 [Pseudomonadota bacterium]